MEPQHRNGQVEQPETPAVNNLQIRTVFSVDDSAYQAWQAEWLAWSFDRVRQPGYLTRLWSGVGEPTPSVPDTFQTRSFSPHPDTGDEFACYNKPLALNEWLKATPSRDETILLVDPDFVFLQPVSMFVRPGKPIAQRISYMNTKKFAQLLERHCQAPEEVQSLGFPVLIHRYDLERLVPLWVEKTEAIRNHPVDREDAGWLAEMWGYVTAAADLGLCHQLQHLAAFQMDICVEIPFIHYCYESQSSMADWRWDKRGYEPGELFPLPPCDVAQASKVLIEQLNMWLADRSTNGSAGFVLGRDRG